MRLLACLLLVCAACSSTDRDEPGVQPDGGSSAANAPKILSLNTNLMTMTSGDRLIVSAVVTDPDGIDDLIGGTLTTTDGSATLGAFATSASEGAYSISLTWSDINATQPISVAADATTPRALRASFYDVEGHNVSRDVTIRLGCSVHQVACGGPCLDQGCGVCGQVCNPCGDGVCSFEELGTCPTDCGG